MKHATTILIALYMLMHNETAQGMLSQLVLQKIKNIRPITLHKKIHVTSHNDSQKTITISYHCLNRLNEIDNNLPAFFRYLQIKFEDKTIQQHYAGRPSLIIEQYKNDAPSLTKFHDADYLNHYLPETYELLDLEFETCYKNTSSLYETKDRINEAFLHLTSGPSLQKLTQQATNQFKLHMIRNDKGNSDIKIYLKNGHHTTDPISLNNITKE